ncbi:MBL fold metallo-hydrolase [Arthrobacter rhombi]|uniref:MBL fold metallo-hydrolase n=1 Tax=Arthrobacter rhombi TaxID=71253 RepID=UPI003FCF6BDD
MSAQATAVPWRRAGERSYALRLEGFAVNAGLVIGDGRAAVIDSGAGPAEAAELYAAVRTLTDLPLVLINTHAHGDHFFGNAYFRAQGVVDIWGHAVAATSIACHGAAQRDLVLEVDPAMAAARGPHTEILAPNRTVGTDSVELDLGGWSITLFHLGPAHTEGDLLIASGDVLFAGDLVEEGPNPNSGAPSPTHGTRPWDGSWPWVEATRWSCPDMGSSWTWISYGTSGRSFARPSSCAVSRSKTAPPTRPGSFPPCPMPRRSRGTCFAG